MPRPADKDLLVAALCRPESMTSLSIGQWNALLRRARSGVLTPKLAVLARRADILGALPERVQRLFNGADIVAAENHRMLSWEMRRIERAFVGQDLRPVILKGGAYVLAGLSAGDGRLSTDVDLLVPKSRLSDAEALLKDQGWVQEKVNAYDDAYYRRWMHEVPPLRHKNRHTLVDLHHTILPLTGRCKPDVEALLADAVAQDGFAVSILASADMLLHSAAHLVQDGDFGYRLRDLFDIHELASEFAEADDNFWPILMDRAEHHQLSRPLAYALSLSHQFFGTKIPDESRVRMKRALPLAPVRQLVLGLASSAVPPGTYGAPQPLKAVAQWLLFIRAHWLRMPPWLLARHLLTKLWMRIRGAA